MHGPDRDVATAVFKGNNKMIRIDGSRGEGGGQIFRSALTLSMCLKQTVRIDNIRAGRKKPGLLRQHLTCLRAAKEICNAKVSGDEPGSSSVTFEPGDVMAGEYQFAVGSAGSTMLVLQTVLLPLLLADAPSSLTVEGGTHNNMAPSFDFVQLAFLPLLARIGHRVEMALDIYGFYPAGGGRWTARIYPADQHEALHLRERGELQSRQAVAMSARLQHSITRRELDHVRKRCYWAEDELQQRLVDSPGPGNIVSLRLWHEHVCEVFDVPGELNRSAERVAGNAVQAMKHYLKQGVAVGEHLADQLLLPLALGKGGSFTTLMPTPHFYSNVEVIRQFLDVDIQVEPLESGNGVLVRVR